MAISKDLGVVTAYGYAVKKGYTGTEEEFAALMKDVADSAGTSEAWAAGTIAGTPVTPEAEQYHNNAKYYAEQAGGNAENAEQSKNSAKKSADTSEAWAVGTVGGVPVEEGQPGYNDNAKYYAEQASDSADAAANSEAAAKDYSDHIADPVSGIVTEWLNDHVDPESQVVIDDSLTIAGAAADAKATGDAVADLKSAVSEIEDDLYTTDTKDETITVPTSDIITGQVAYINTTNNIATYANANAYVLHMPVQAGDSYSITSQTHGSTNTLLWAVVNADGVVIDSATMGVPAETYITTDITIPDGGAYLYLNYFPVPARPLVVIQHIVYNISVIDGVDTVCCWGDSLTRGVGVGNSYNKAYPYVLQGILNKKVINCGVGGENTYAIMSRQGSLPCIVQPVTIPADNTPVEITLKTPLGDTATILRQGGSALDPDTGAYYMTAQINPCVIDGIEGTLSFEDNTYKFVRSVNGDSKVIQFPVVLETYGMEKLRNTVCVLWMGTNGGYTTGEELARLYKTMVDYMTSINKRYLIIGNHYKPSTVTDTLEQTERIMTQTFGRNFINQRAYMIQYGLEENNITPTQEDIDAIAQGNIPPSLLNSDGIHYNEYSYKVIANLVARRCAELGFFES